jgi:hypothetical protein
MKKIKYTQINEPITKSIQKCLLLAEKHNCKVVMQLTGMKVIINKRMSVRHVYMTFVKMIKARITKSFREAFGINNAIIKASRRL